MDEKSNQENENNKTGIMQKVKNISACVLAGFFLLLVLGTIGTPAMFLFLLMAVAVLPLKPVRNLWGMLPRKMKWVKPILFIVLFFVAVDMTPTSTGASEETDHVLQAEQTETETSVPEATSSPVETTVPTKEPTPKPIETPTLKPTATPTPTVQPTATPTPTVRPTATPTVQPTATPEPTVKPTEAPTPKPTEVPTQEPISESAAMNQAVAAPVAEPAPAAAVPPAGQGSFAVNSKNGKIHMVGACPATGSGDNAMKSPVYFNTYEEAESYSVSIAPSQKKRKCGNCW